MMNSPTFNNIGCGVAGEHLNAIREAAAEVNGKPSAPSDEGHPEGGGAIFINNVNKGTRTKGTGARTVQPRQSLVGNEKGAGSVQGAALGLQMLNDAGRCWNGSE